MEIKNAVIKRTNINIERGILTIFLHLEYRGSGQGFGGYCLYVTKSNKDFATQRNVAGHFIYRCLEVIGVENWEDLIGKAVRVIADWNKVYSIGNILEEKWFNPDKEFEELRRINVNSFGNQTN